jgi:hypothetical protein
MATEGSNQNDLEQVYLSGRRIRLELLQARVSTWHDAGKVLDRGEFSCIV